ncbi:MAG TPA: fructose 1,6-bisphosphatase, partial [Actinomycetota bacterium]|nr:fructose 1,6-bisphosphatase [Actinomycetota bacterium]
MPDGPGVRGPLDPGPLPGREGTLKGPEDREAAMKLTLSTIKADTGGFVGHTEVHPEMRQVAEEATAEAVSGGLLLDAHVDRVGDDLAL